MAAFARTQSDAVLVDGYATLPSDWQDLDSKQFRAVNGDRGGTWAPSAPIQLAAGNLTVTGPIKVFAGGELRGDGTAAAFVLAGASEWPMYDVGHPFRKRKILQTPIMSESNSRPSDWILDRQTQSLKSLALTVTAPGVAITPISFSMTLRVHDGARLARALLHFRIPQVRVKAPLTTPKMRIIRVDLDGNVSPMKSPASGADVDGFVSVPKPAGAAAWYALGAPQSLTYECDQSNVIDTSLYHYFLEVYEESGTLSPLDFTGFTSVADGLIVRERKADCLRESNIALGTLTGNLNVGGVMSTPGERLLIVAQANAAQNGIWIASAGAWSRAPDLAFPTDFTNGFVVAATTSRSPWEVAPPYPKTIGTDPIAFRAPTPNGNVYHSVVTEFEDIADMRFQ